MNYQKELTFAIEAVRKAGKLCREVQHKLVSADSMEKKDRSPVTIADLGSQAIVTLSLQRDFPGEMLVGEEDSTPLRENAELKERVHLLLAQFIDPINDATLYEAIDFGNQDPNGTARFWTLDPIDGTKGFLRGEQYAVALALIEQGQVVLGVLGCPNLPLSYQHLEKGEGCLLYAVRGEGCWMEPLDGGERIPVKVDGFTNPAEARFCESIEKEHASHEVHEQISRVMGIHRPPFRIDSQCKYAAVARGDASIYFRLPRSSSYREKIWDHAAGVVVLEEAGGKVTDFRGFPLDFSCGKKLENNIGLVATNGALHDLTLKAISEVVHLT
ncbi:MAG: 3'(2'),5'-bisphosphate nucleotidase [Calditrichaeota bacterium]|nr:MAG: 3'(2'),5'-bisphosphate nucleotidase [Calditrichota bacterium]